jgi:hypothetical protein
LQGLKKIIFSDKQATELAQLKTPLVFVQEYLPKALKSVFFVPITFNNRTSFEPDEVSDPQRY